jgi:membrane peptidoglycan carboxypeptidase
VLQKPIDVEESSAQASRVFLAQDMACYHSKPRIFEIYLNAIEWGDNIYGLQGTAQTYYGKSAGKLLPEEAAILVAMIPNPRRYTPSRNLKYLESRKTAIFERMGRYTYLTPEECKAARARPVVARQLS